MNNNSNTQELVEIFNGLPKTYQEALLGLAIDMEKQVAKDLVKYGIGLDEAKDADYDWHEMAGEEIADMLVYLQRAKNQIKKS